MPTNVQELRDLWDKREAAEATLISRLPAYNRLNIRKLKSVSASWDKLADADRKIDLWLKAQVGKDLKEEVV